MILNSRQKIAFLMSGVVSLSLIIVMGTVVYINHYQWYSHEESELLDEVEEFIKDGIDANETEDDEEDNAENYYFKDSVGEIYIKGLFYDKRFFEKIFEHEYNTTFKINHFDHKLDTERIFLTTIIDYNGILVGYAEDITTYIEYENRLINSSLIILIFSILFSFILGLFIAGIILKPLQTIINKTKSASLENMPKNLLIKGKDSDEMVQLSKTLLALFEKIKRSTEQIKQFNHDVSHELKTPLAIIKSDIELAIKTKNLKNLDNTIADIDNLSDIIEKLLFLAHKNENINIKEISSAEFIEIVENLLKKFNSAFQASKINYEVNIKDDLKIQANESLLKDMMSNLIENAFKYNIKKGNISISSEKNKIVISNTSPQISNKNIENIFKVFYRVDNVRSKDGYGIGLSIVKKICDLFHWNINASYENETMTFEITI